MLRLTNIVVVTFVFVLPTMDLCFAELIRQPAGPMMAMAQGTHAFNVNSYHYYVQQQLKEDVFALTRLGREMTREVGESRETRDYRRLSKRAHEIRKRANRIKKALTFGQKSREGSNSLAIEQKMPNPEMLRKDILHIGALVRTIRGYYSRLGRHVINAKVQTELYETVETLESVASRVKEDAQQLSQVKQ